MKRLSRIDTLWLLLTVATLVTWQVGDSGRGGLAIVALVFALAAAKGGLVILDFMELRQAPALWRRLVLGWLFAVTAAILLFYSIGPR
jgi:hypothetical protein